MVNKGGRARVDWRPQLISDYRTVNCRLYFHLNRVVIMTGTTRVTIILILYILPNYIVLSETNLLSYLECIDTHGLHHITNSIGISSWTVDQLICTELHLETCVHFKGAFLK